MEVTQLAIRGRVALGRGPREWVARALSYPLLAIAPISAEIAMRAAELRSDINRDPADCLIAATAVTAGVPLVSKDRRIAAMPGVRVIW